MEQIVLGLVVPGVAVAEPCTHTLSIADNDIVGVVISETNGSTVVNEETPATVDTISVRLETPPDRALLDRTQPGNPASYGPPADVTMTITPDRDDIVKDGNTVGTPSSPLVSTIANANWKDGKTLTVLAVDDKYDEDLRVETVPHECQLTFTFDSLDPIYDIISDSFILDVIDNDVANVIMGAAVGPTVLAEGNPNVNRYSVHLNSVPDPGKPLPLQPDPVPAVTSVVFTPSAGCQVRLGTVGAAWGSTASLTFNSGNYLVDQFVEIGPIDNLMVELDRPCTMATSITSTGFKPDTVYLNIDDAPPYPGFLASKTASLEDYRPSIGITDDPPRVLITTTTGTNVAEAGTTTDTLSVVLHRAPVGVNVTVTLLSADDGNSNGVDSGINGPQSPHAAEERRHGRRLGQPDVHSGELEHPAGGHRQGRRRRLRRERHPQLADHGDDVVDDGRGLTVSAPAASTTRRCGTSTSTASSSPVTARPCRWRSPTTTPPTWWKSSPAERRRSTRTAHRSSTTPSRSSWRTCPYAAVSVAITSDAECTVNSGVPNVLIQPANWNVPVSIPVVAVNDTLKELDNHPVRGDGQSIEQRHARRCSRPRSTSTWSTTSRPHPDHHLGRQRDRRHRGRWDRDLRRDPHVAAERAGHGQLRERCVLCRRRR